MCRATHDGWVMVESSDKTWSAEEGNGKPLQYSYLENPMDSMKRQKDRTLKDELPRLVGHRVSLLSVPQRQVWSSVVSTPSTESMAGIQGRSDE